MSLPLSPFRSNSLLSTLASIALHIAIGAILYFGVVEFLFPPKPQYITPPELNVSFAKPTAVTATLLDAEDLPKAHIVPPIEYVPSADESIIPTPPEIVRDDDHPFVRHTEVRPWMPSHLRVRPITSQVKPNNAPKSSQLDTPAASVEVVAQKDTQQCPPPEYPRSARAKKQEGVVTLLLEIRADGQVNSAQIHQSSGHAVLDRAALIAVRTWKYFPASSNGVPQASRLLQAIVFSIENS
ncbi:MAG: TonB family protein [Planctomycetota bacterium]|jgi:protein TonB|nr:TonB family protein [Planctomycetota bacterium]